MLVRRIAALLVIPLALSASLPLAACKSDGHADANKSLYERLGGEKGVTAVVDDFVALAAADPKVNFARNGTTKKWEATPENVAKVKKGLIDFIGGATGGPQKYAGKPMKEVHTGMQITGAQFDAVAADLKATLARHNVPKKETDELLAIVATTRRDVVEKEGR